MPCTYYTPEEERQIMSRDHEKEVSKLKKELDRTTQLLCSICRNHFNEVEDDIQEIPGLLSWWRHHEKMDNLRKEAEKKQKLQEKIRKQEEINELESKLRKLKNNA